MPDKFVHKSDSTQELVNLKMEINNLRQEAKVTNSDTKAEIIQWIGGIGVVQMALIAGLFLKIGH